MLRRESQLIGKKPSTTLERKTSAWDLKQQRYQSEGREGICYQAHKTVSGHLAVPICDGSVEMHHGAYEVLAPIVRVNSARLNPLDSNLVVDDKVRSVGRGC